MTVSDAPRCQVLRKEIVEKIPDILNIRNIEKILSELPSLGGDWEQYYHIEIKWTEGKR